VVSWSLLTVHMNPAIALQLVWGSYNGQHRRFTSKKDRKKHITSGPEFVFRIALTICYGLYNSDQGYWKFCRTHEKAVGWERILYQKKQRKDMNCTTQKYSLVERSRTFNLYVSFTIMTTSKRKKRYLFNETRLKGF